MATHKFLQEEGTESLCGHVKLIRQTVDATRTALVDISTALQSLASESEDLINEVEGDIESLNNAILAREVTAAMGTRAKMGITTRSGAEIYAYRIL